MTVAVCFWGLTRSLKYTIESIAKNIFEELNKHDIGYHIYIHTYRLDKPFTNPHGQEMGILLDNEEYKMLKPSRVLVEDQLQVANQLNVLSYGTMGNPWPNTETFINHILALWSLKQVTSLWSPKAAEYSKVIYLRPDMYYPCPIDIKWIQNQSHAIYMPYFQRITYNKNYDRAVNDRFAIGAPATMKIYGNRFDEALAYSKTKVLHSETFLEDTLSRHHIHIQYIHYHFIRVRANGAKVPLDEMFNKVGCIVKSGGSRKRRRRRV